MKQPSARKGSWRPDASNEASPLLGASSSSPPGPSSSGSDIFNATERPVRDRVWLYAYLLLIAATVGGGVYGILHRNPAFTDIATWQSLNDPATCPKETHARGLKQEPPAPDEESFRLDAFMAHPVLLSVGAFSAAIVLGVGFVSLIKKSAHLLVVTAIALQVGLPLGIALSLIVMGVPIVATIPLLGMVGLLVLLFWLWREQIGLVVKLLGVAAHALVECPGLITMGLGLQVALMFVVAPIILLILAASSNGKVVYNPMRDMNFGPPDGSLSSSAASTSSASFASFSNGVASYFTAAAEKGGTDPDPAPPACTALSGEAVPCCMWDVDPWVKVYYSLASVALTWTIFLLCEIKVFTVAGTVAQWYFGAKAFTPFSQLPSSSSSSPRSKTRVGLSLTHALTSSLGSLCFSSAVLTLVSYLRQMMEKARRDGGKNIFFCLLKCFMDLILTFIEFVTKFATVRMAMTGEGFTTATRGAYDLLKRNFLDAFGVWWLPPLILQNCAFVVAGAFGALTWAGSYALWGGEPVNLMSSGVLALIAFLSAWVVLAFFCNLLLNVVDSVFVCFAVDRDIHACTRMEVHEVYSYLPTVGQVVEQPDGSMLYGAPPVAGAPPQVSAANRV